MHYPRIELADQIADALQGKNPFGDAPNGLFLAAPRRTGKSTFLQADLKPALERRGVAVIYVDFWANPRRDPGELLAEALAKAVAPHVGPISKLAAKSGLSNTNKKAFYDTPLQARLSTVGLCDDDIVLCRIRNGVLTTSQRSRQREDLRDRSRPRARRTGAVQHVR